MAVAMVMNQGCARDLKRNIKDRIDIRRQEMDAEFNLIYIFSSIGELKLLLQNLLFFQTYSFTVTRSSALNVHTATAFATAAVDVSGGRGICDIPLLR